MGRLVGIGPGDGLARGDRHAGGPESEGADVHAERSRRRGRRGRHHGPARQRRVGDHVVDLVVGLVALEARLVVGLVVELAVRSEGRVLPLAVADVVSVLGAPAGAFLHHRVGDQVALHEASLGVLERSALGVHLGLVLDQGQDGAARERLALLGRLDGGGARIELAVLLDVVPVGDGVEDPILVLGREGDLLRTGAAARDHRGQRGQDQGHDDEPENRFTHPPFTHPIPSICGRDRTLRGSLRAARPPVVTTV